MVTEQKYLESQGVDTSDVDTSDLPPADYGATQDLPHMAAGAGAGAGASCEKLMPPVDPTGPKKLVEAYILCFPLGLVGAHHFYLRRYGFGVLYLLTFGLLGVGFIVDLFRLPWLVRDANRRINSERLRRSQPQPCAAPLQPKSLADAYVLWFPLGLFGLHHFYLMRIGWGFLYLLTFGLFGIGWLLDGCRMKSIVDHVNRQRAATSTRPYKEKSVCDTYVLTANPLTGLLGIQHYYLGRVGFGIFYTFTLGGLGIGWLVDIVRMPWVVRDVNKRNREGDTGLKRLDDAYVLCFPLGWLGLHHFFLQRPCWGVLYLLTCGCFGIGWIIDWFRLPFLVREYNSKVPGRINTVSGSTPQGADNTVIIVAGGNHPAANHPAAPPAQPPYPQQYQQYSQQYPEQYPQQQYPQLQNPQQQYPQQQYPGQILGPQPPQYYPSVDYGASGETSWSTINSSDFGDQPPTYHNQPPSYAASQVGDEQVPDPKAENAANQQRAAPPRPTAPPGGQPTVYNEKKDLNM